MKGKDFKYDKLYRKVNTKARGSHHNSGPSYSYRRNTKNPDTSMKQNVKRGLDYTPLFKFLLSRVGEDFDTVYSEAIKRLDKDEPIFYMINKLPTDKQDFFRYSETSFYSSLYVDENNKIQKVNPNLNQEDIPIFCSCCTHTLNGKTITTKEAKNKNKEEYLKFKEEQKEHYLSQDFESTLKNSNKKNKD